MVYCDSCARILDEDVQFCPHCNSEDANWQEKPAAPDYKPPAVFRGEVFDRLREINQHIEENPNPNTYKTNKQEEKPAASLYIIIIMMSACLSIVGLIMGIVYASKKNKNYRDLGVVAIVISSIFLLFGVVSVIGIVLMVSYM